MCRSEETNLLDETGEQVIVPADLELLGWLIAQNRPTLREILRQAMLDQHKSRTPDVILQDALGLDIYDPASRLAECMKMLEEWTAGLGPDPGDDSEFSTFMHDVDRVADSGLSAVLHLQEDVMRFKDDPGALTDAVADAASKLVSCIPQWEALRECLCAKGLFQKRPPRKRQRPAGVVTVALALIRRELCRGDIDRRQIEAVAREILRREGGATTRAANPANAARRAIQHQRQRATAAQQGTRSI